MPVAVFNLDPRCLVNYQEVSTHISVFRIELTTRR